MKYINIVLMFLVITFIIVKGGCVMTDLPADGYWENAARTEANIKDWGDDIRDFIAQMLGGSAETELTISGGAVTPTAGIHSIDTQGDASSDDLNNILQTNLPDGSLLVLRAEDAARTVVVKDGSGGIGQILLYDSADYSLDETEKYLVLIRDGTVWYEVARTPVTASTTEKGIAELATEAEVEAGTDVARVVTAATFFKGVGFLMKGLATRSQFAYKDTDEIYIGAGCYHLNGTVECLVWWDDLLTLDIGAPSADTWYYIYIDDSAVTPGTALTASEFIFSSTFPAWNKVKHGWYNGNDRCIGAVLTNASAEITPFYHSGEYVAFNASLVNASVIDPDTTWTDVTLDVPYFCTLAQVLFYADYNDVSASLTYRPDGKTDTSILLCEVNVTTQTQYISAPVVPDGGIIEVRFSSVGANTVSVYTQGWYFPVGM